MRTRSLSAAFAVLEKIVRLVVATTPAAAAAAESKNWRRVIERLFVESGVVLMRACVSFATIVSSMYSDLAELHFVYLVGTRNERQLSYDDATTSYTLAFVIWEKVRAHGFSFYGKAPFLVIPGEAETQNPRSRWHCLDSPFRGNDTLGVPAHANRLPRLLSLLPALGVISDFQPAKVNVIVETSQVVAHCCGVAATVQASLIDVETSPSEPSAWRDPLSTSKPRRRALIPTD